MLNLTNDDSLSTDGMHGYKTLQCGIIFSMATERQKKLAQVIVENATLDKPLNRVEMLEKVGYSTNTAEAKAADIIEADGVQQELEVLGFTEGNAKQVVRDILLDEEQQGQTRLKAADMVFKVHGTYAPEKKDLTTGGEKLADATIYEQYFDELEAKLFGKRTGKE